MSVREYQDLLLESGLPFQAPRSSLAAMCGRFMESARVGVLGENANLIAATRPDVTCAVWLGFFSSGGDRKDGALVLPRARSVLEDIRDAMWVEGDSVRKPWSKDARRIAAALEATAAELGEPLGPRSTLCHQEKTIAAVAPTATSSSAVRVKVDLGGDLGFPEPSFLSFDMDLDTGETANSATRLGLALLDPPGRHRHVWTEFAAAIPDAKGPAGACVGEVCLVRRDNENAHPGVCLATRSVRFRMSRNAALSVTPAWVKVDNPVLRPVLWIPKGHRHVWEEGRVALGASASLLTLRCVTCSAELWSNKVWGETIPDLMTEWRRKLARTGGFARTPTERLREVGRELKARWGAYLGQYADALAMMACGSGLEEPDEAQRERAEEIVGISRQQDVEALRAAMVDFWRAQKLDDETLDLWVEHGFLTREQADVLRSSS